MMAQRLDHDEMVNRMDNALSKMNHVITELRTAIEELRTDLPDAEKTAKTRVNEER